MTRFSVIESGAVAQLQTLVPATFAQVTAVPADALFQQVPDVYPAALVTVQEARKVSAEWTGGHVRMVYTIPVWIGVYAASDGVSIGDARVNVWALVDSILNTLTGYAISLSPNAFGPFTPDNITPFSIEVGKYAVIVGFTVMMIFTI